ncbi:hypothetical protein FB451DRAFT_1397011 [Mycena latifolia]|nr:hypothetical protein FB451DRAFT_1397011 [Mycena latifolia]
MEGKSLEIVRPSFPSLYYTLLSHSHTFAHMAQRTATQAQDPPPPDAAPHRTPISDVRALGVHAAHPQAARARGGGAESRGLGGQRASALGVGRVKATQRSASSNRSPWRGARGALASVGRAGAKETQLALAARCLSTLRIRGVHAHGEGERLATLGLGASVSSVGRVSDKAPERSASTIPAQRSAPERVEIRDQGEQNHAKDGEEGAGATREILVDRGKDEDEAQEEDKNEAGRDEFEFLFFFF